MSAIPTTVGVIIFYIKHKNGVYAPAALQLDCVAFELRIKIKI